MRRRFALAAMAAAMAMALLAGCHKGPNPYRDQGRGNPPPGTPADRTGGARNVPDNAGPVKKPGLP